jgi:hypothetical protein
MKKYPLFVILLLVSLVGRGQRIYAESSVLSSGSWVKVSTKASGVYKITANFMKEAGFSTKIPSNSVKLFGNGGGVLPEANSAVIQDDLVENAILVYDGGDGFFDGDDYFFFYAQGADHWAYDSLGGRFVFKKNIYSGNTYFFITVAESNGKRISTLPMLSGVTTSISDFDEYYRHELDSINFLKSGQEWYGEEFSQDIGAEPSINFPIPFSDLISGSNYSFRSQVIGRSVGQSNTFSIFINGQEVVNQLTPPLAGSALDPMASPSLVSTEGILSETSMLVSYQFDGGSINAKGWLNWFDVFFKRSLNLGQSPQLQFRHLESVGPGNLARFQLRNATASTLVWDITNRLTPNQVTTVLDAQQLSFVADCSSLREYIAFKPEAVMLPKLEGNVPSQNLHGLAAFDMLIVCNKNIVSEANRLAQYHRQRNGLKTIVLELGQLYNEFSSGTPDPSAIRNFLKMAYDRALLNPMQRPKYLLLFGSATYDYKFDEDDQFVPSYQSESSLDALTSYVTDDYFGYLDDEDDIRTVFPFPLLDLAIGRIPARNLEQARVAVDKIIEYHSNAAFGKWRNSITLVADDEDYNIHLNDAELHASLIQVESPVLNINKIYLDAYPQQSSSGGSLYPSVNDAITKQINKGTLVWNYSGHGGSSRLAQESILDKDMVAGWKNTNRLPLFVTATCDFAPFDNPAEFSLGEDLFIGRRNGAIGLVTTTRLVFASSNKVINNNFFSFLFKKNSEQQLPTLGAALQDTKNFTIVNTGDYINARKFTLLGDPALKLAMPEYSVTVNTINGRPILSNSDTLRSQNDYTIAGEVLTPSGTLATDFNGYVYPTVYDKAAKISTLANDSESSKVDFSSQENMLFDGKVKAENGKFSFTFIVPRDINYKFGNGRISLYAENGVYDASGVDERLVVGGLGNEVSNDETGPDIKGYLNDETFKNGDVVGERPLLIAKFYEASGINISGIGIGHDITAVIDGDNRNMIILNDYLEPELSGLLKGTVRFQLPQLSEGKHRIVVKAWDVFNNSGECIINCEVIRQKDIFITRLINYPNPFSGSTRFLFNLDGPYAGAEAQIDIFTLSGQLVKKLGKVINEVDGRSIEIEWNGRDDSGDALGGGIYIFRLIIKGREGQVSKKMQKLIIL